MTQKRMLVIDDDVGLQDLLRSYFKAEGWEVDSCRTGGEGLRSAVKTRPTVILLDLMLPDGDGWSVLARLKAEASLSGVPVVMVSGCQRRPEDKVTGLVVGADDYIAKPLDLDILSAKLNALLRMKLEA